MGLLTAWACQLRGLVSLTLGGLQPSIDITEDSIMKNETNYQIHNFGQTPVKAWTKGVPVEESAMQQLANIASMPFIHKHVAVMPDVHWGMGATVGSVIPTKGAIIPAAVGVDIGCGMMATKTSLKAKHLPDNLKKLRSEIEKAVPHGRTDNGGKNDRGAWGEIPFENQKLWDQELKSDLDEIIQKHPQVRGRNDANHLGTLGTGNHFIEVCLDEEQNVWVMLHSGSRGIGNRIGRYFIELAKKDMRNHLQNLPDKNLAYLKEGTEYFEDYIQAVSWAQRYAHLNRELMMQSVLEAMKDHKKIPEFTSGLEQAVNCHHNYVAQEDHFGEKVWLTRKGAVKASEGQLGIIPGSMGAKSYIVRGKGNPESFHSCSHGAGRAMSRSAAKKRYSLDDHIKATKDVECRKDKEVIDETPMAYKKIDKVMEAQKDLVDIVHTLKQVLCVKG